MVPPTQGPKWQRARMVELSSGLERGRVAAWQRIGSPCTAEPGLERQPGSRPVKARSIGFPHQVCGGCMVTAFPTVDFRQELEIFRSEDALH
jgi:hypothetical protein